MRIVFIFLMLVNAVYFLWQVRTQVKPPDLSVDVGIPSLVLFSELPKEVTPDNVNLNQGNELVPKDSLDKTQGCAVLGGFNDQSTAEQATRFLSEHGIAGKLNVLETQGTGSYLVYLPPFQSRIDALNKFHELQAKGIDSFVIADGDRVNGISLGVFAKEELAKKLQAQLKNKGYSSSIVNSARVLRQYTFQIANQSVGRLTESLETELSQKYARGNLTRTNSSCPITQ